MKKIVAIVHPFLFTLDSLLFFYVRAMSEVSPEEMLRPLLVLWIIVLALYPLARKVGGSRDWTGILLTIFVFGFFFHKDYFVTVGILAVVVILALLGCLLLLKQHVWIFHISLSLAMLSSVMLVMHSIALARSLRSIPVAYYEAIETRKKTASIPLSEPVSGTKPDIYYIVLDTYSGTDVLQDFYGYDNSAFIDFLKGRGFIVPDTVFSNYPRTALSISSTLDMQYWDTISPNMDQVVYWWPVKPVLNHSRVRESLESIGYQSISIATDWELANNRTTDYYFKPFPVVLTEYEDFIITSTSLQVLYKPLQNIAPVRTSEIHRRFFAYNVETLTKIPEISGPKFVFVHIVPPHPPFVFSADGSPINSNLPFTFGDPAGISRDEYRQNYIEQVKYVNTQLRLIVDAILDKSATPPIILFQADHGLGLSVGFGSIEKACLRERLSVFGAYYLPGVGPDVIPQDFTSVNLFRIIFNEYFGANLELLENKQYYTKGHNLFAGMQNVTERARSRCVAPALNER